MLITQAYELIGIGLFLLKTSVKYKSNGIIPQDETRQTNLALALIHIQLGGAQKLIPMCCISQILP